MVFFVLGSCLPIDFKGTTSNVVKLFTNELLYVYKYVVTRSNNVVILTLLLIKRNRKVFILKLVDVALLKDTHTTNTIRVSNLSH